MKYIRSIGMVLATGMVMGLGCQLIAGANPDATYAESGGGGTGGVTASTAASSTGSGVTAATTTSSSSSSSSSSGGMGGMGGAMGGECNSVADCPVFECRSALLCNNGVCLLQFNPDGEPTASQLYGDCKNRVCDGLGEVKVVDGDGIKDAYDWANPCFLKACDAVSTPMPNDGVMCMTAWGNPTGHCSAFTCIECTVDADCGVNKCQLDRCVPMTCTDTIKNGNETDINCGGPDCHPCTTNKACTTNSDCQGTCDSVTMKCVARSCYDGIRNADETDVDCGGSCFYEMPPKKCAPLQKCLFPKDCQSGVCKIGTCQPASCIDYTKNQDEEFIDCGGMNCDPCPSP